MGCYLGPIKDTHGQRVPDLGGKVERGREEERERERVRKRLGGAHFRFLHLHINQLEENKLEKNNTFCSLL